MTSNLTSTQTLEEIRREARILLRDLRRQDVAAVKLYSFLDPEAGTFRARLADAQYVIARKHGCRSWRDLQQHLLRPEKE